MRHLTPLEIRAMLANSTMLSPGLMERKIYAMAGPSMLTMDVFKQDAFSAVNMTAAIDKEGFVPTALSEIPNLFVPPPLGQPHSKVIFVEERNNEPAIIHTSPRGSFPDVERSDEKTREARPFVTHRLYKKRRITATEIAGIRVFGSITEVQSLEERVARLQYLMQRDMSLTWENMRLGAVQGKVLDSDGSVLDDWTSATTGFGQALQPEKTFVFASTGDGSVRTQCSEVRRNVIRALKGLGGTGVKVYGLASDSWWDALMASDEVRKTYQAEKALLLQEGVTWQQYEYGGITFINYRGTDDNSSVAVPDKKVKFFPAGTGIFQEVFSPADERFEFLDTPGQSAYAWIVLDPLRNMWADVEMVSYPLFVCTMPSALASGKIT